MTESIDDVSIAQQAKSQAKATFHRAEIKTTREKLRADDIREAIRMKRQEIESNHTAENESELSILLLNLNHQFQVFLNCLKDERVAEALYIAAVERYISLLKLTGSSEEVVDDDD